MYWKPILGYEGYYEVSMAGEVRSVDRMVCGKDGHLRQLRGKKMRLTKSKGRDGDGYYVVNLRKNGKSDVRVVHVLVATAFIDNPNNLPTVNHIDGDKSNNCASNLEWTSYADNNIHALRTGLRKPRGTSVVQKTMDGREISWFRSVCEASRVTGIGRSSISHCVNSHIDSAGGFIWEKVSEGVTTIS